MTHELVRAAVLCKIGTYHFWLNFYRVEGLPVIHADHWSDHFWYNDHLDFAIQQQEFRFHKTYITSVRYYSHVPIQQTRQNLILRIIHPRALALTFRKWVLTTSGFSWSGASFFALLSFLINAIGFLVSPLLNFLRARDVNNGRSSTGFKVRSASRSTPRNVNFLKVRRFPICWVPPSPILRRRLRTGHSCATLLLAVKRWTRHAALRTL